MEEKYINLMNYAIRQLLWDALKISIKNPSLAWYILRAVIWQKRAAGLRSKYVDQGIQIPPYMIASITKKCNLNCKGWFDCW